MRKNMTEARRKLNAELATHAATMEYLLFDVAEDGFSVLAIAEMSDDTDIIVAFDLPSRVDPDDEDERRRLMAEFSRAHIVPVSGERAAQFKTETTDV